MKRTGLRQGVSRRQDENAEKSGFANFSGQVVLILLSY
jgi:hypothetical protein